MNRCVYSSPDSLNRVLQFYIDTIKEIQNKREEQNHEPLQYAERI